jgi:hypothetical protein
MIKYTLEEAQSLINRLDEVLSSEFGKIITDGTGCPLFYSNFERCRRKSLLGCFLLPFYIGSLQTYVDDWPPEYSLLTIKKHLKETNNRRITYRWMRASYCEFRQIPLAFRMKNNPDTGDEFWKHIVKWRLEHGK